MGETSTSNISLINKSDVDVYKEEFKKIGIVDEAEMFDILCGLDQIAEIGYCWYKRHKKECKK